MGVVTNFTDKYQACIDACTTCAQACYECFKECLNEQDIAARKDNIHMLVECANMCQMSAAMMSMDGQYSKEHCKLCATICDSCAQGCSQFADNHSQKCAEVCRQCADECRKM